MGRDDTGEDAWSAPVLLGAGTRLLDDDGHIRLQPTRITESSKATHLRYRVLTVDGTG